MPSRKKKGLTAGRVGRPPAGDRGERVTDYPQVSFRLPKTARDKLLGLSKLRNQPQWRLIVDSVEGYIARLTAQDRVRLAQILSKGRSRTAE